jgi:hypothetical protein
VVPLDDMAFLEAVEMQAALALLAARKVRGLEDGQGIPLVTKTVSDSRPQVSDTVAESLWARTLQFVKDSRDSLPVAFQGPPHHGKYIRHTPA